MIRFRLAELMAEHNFRTGGRLQWRDVSEATGIHRTTLSKLLNTRSYNATTNNVDLLCRFFDCSVADLMVYVPDESVSTPVKRSFKGPTANTPAAKAGAAARHGKAAATPARTPRKHAAKS